MFQTVTAVHRSACRIVPARAALMTLSRTAIARGRTRRLLVCGALAGPAFVAVTGAQVLSRNGFDIRRHGISLLSLGDHGWIQVANFALAGALSLAFGQGVRRVLGSRRRLLPGLISGYGVGLIATAAFLVDAGEGFPPGTPDGVPGTLSWHGAVHAVAPPAAFACLVASCLIFARHFALKGRRGWAAYSAVTGLVAAALIFWPGSAGSVRSALAVLVTSTWTTAVAGRLLADTADS